METETERKSVPPEQRFVGPHTPVCHAEREKTLSGEKTEAKGGGCGTHSATLEAIKFDILKPITVFINIYIFIGQKNHVIVQDFLMLNILPCDQFCLY